MWLVAEAVPPSTVALRRTDDPSWPIVATAERFIDSSNNAGAAVSVPSSRAFVPMRTAPSTYSLASFSPGDTTLSPITGGPWTTLELTVTTSDEIHFCGVRAGIVEDILLRSDMPPIIRPLPFAHCPGGYLRRLPVGFLMKGVDATVSAESLAIRGVTVAVDPPVNGVGGIELEGTNLIAAEGQQPPGDSHTVVITPAGETVDLGVFTVALRAVSTNTVAVVGSRPDGSPNGYSQNLVRYHTVLGRQEVVVASNRRVEPGNDIFVTHDGSVLINDEPGGWGVYIWPSDGPLVNPFDPSARLELCVRGATQTICEMNIGLPSSRALYFWNSATNQLQLIPGSQGVSVRGVATIDVDWFIERTQTSCWLSRPLVGPAGDITLEPRVACQPLTTPFALGVDEERAPIVPVYDGSTFHVFALRGDADLLARGSTYAFVSEPAGPPFIPGAYDTIHGVTGADAIGDFMCLVMDPAQCWILPPGSVEWRKVRRDATSIKITEVRAFEVTGGGIGYTIFRPHKYPDRPPAQ
jgi:hypothetical protein